MVFWFWKFALKFGHMEKKKRLSIVDGSSPFF